MTLDQWLECLRLILTSLERQPRRSDYVLVGP